MSRHRRLQKTLRSPQREARQWFNREGRRVRRAIREGIAEHFADGHVHDGPGCPFDPPAEVSR